MPCNEASGISCTILPACHPHLSASPSYEEYQHHAARSSVTDAIQEIVFVESTAGTSFEIHLEITAEAYAKLHRCRAGSDRELGANDYLVDVHLDGVTVSRYFIKPTPQPSCLRLFSSISSDRQTIRTFQFGQLVLVDPDDDMVSSEAAHKLTTELCDNEHVISNLGTIRVDIIRCQLGAPRAWSPDRSPCLLRTSNQMKFSERTKKACLSNTAGLSENSVPSPFVKKDMIKSLIEWKDPNPFLQFVFNYRSRALLEAQGIVRPPTPQHSEPIKLAPDHSRGNFLLRTPLGQPIDEKTKPKPKCIEIDSDEKEGHDVKPNAAYPTQSTSRLADDLVEDVKIATNEKNSTVASTTKTGKDDIKRFFVIDGDDLNKQEHRKKKSKVIDLTRD